MTQAPFLRSAALQKSLALQPVRRASATPTTSFAQTLQSAQASRAISGVRSVPAAARTTLTGDVPFKDLIQAAAVRNGVDPALLAGLVKQESNFNPNAQSPAGARGLTQLMPATARGLGVTDPSDPAQGLEAGAKFLGGLLRQFGGNESLALAAYNAGPGAVQKFGGIPPYEETQRYVPKVLGNAAQYRRIWAGSNGTQNV